MKKGVSLPSSIEFCHKRILHLEETLEAASEAMNKLQNEAQEALTEKDRLRAEMCKKCSRGIR